MADGGKLIIKIDGDDSGFKQVTGGLSKVGGPALKGLAVSATAVGTAVIGIGTAAIKAYGDFEQLAGGAELMFGEAFGYIEERAKNAFNTVQLSQNDYLKQVNGFAVGLKTAMGGSEQAAAELADKIINAEADVIAATGNAAENVQNAFNGIMKNNFTMLDNLQIGITPTKEGFQELIDKVNVWNAENGKMTQYTIDNVADCQSALVDYIEMQGLSGYAAEEASGTIQGSFAMLKASITDLFTGLTDPEQDIGVLIENVFESLIIFAENIKPRIQEVLSGIGNVIQELAPLLITEIMNLIPEIIPVIIDGGIQLGTSFIKAITDQFPLLADGLTGIGIIFASFKIGTAIQGIVTGFQNAKLALALFSAEANGVSIAQAALNGTLKAGEVITALLTGKMTLAELAQAALAKGQAILNAVMAANPVALVVIAIGALIAIFVTLWNNCEGFREFWIDLWDKIVEWVSGAVEKIKVFFTQKVPQAFQAVIDFIKNNWQSILLFITNPIAGALSLLYNLNPKFKEWVDGLVAKIKSWFSGMVNIGKNIVDGLWEGIQNAKNWLLGKIREWCGSILNGIKAFFGIASPAKSMIPIGQYIVEGLALGVDRNGYVAINALRSLGYDMRTEVEKVQDEIANSSMSIEDMIRFEEPDYSKLTLKEQRYVDNMIAYNKTKRYQDREDEKQKLIDSRDEKIKNAKDAAEKSKAWAEWEKAENERINKENEEDAQRARERLEYDMKKSVEDERKLIEAAQKDVANNQEKILDTFTQMATEAYETLEDLESARQDLADRLKDHSSLFEIKTGQYWNGDSYEKLLLTDWDKKNAELTKFNDNLLALQDRAELPAGFFDKVRDLPVNDAIRFTDRLLNANDEEFTKYIEGWKENQELSETYATNLYADETEKALKEIEGDFEAFGTTLDSLGAGNAEAWGKGFLEEVRKQIPVILDAINSAFGGIISLPSYALESGNTVQHYTTYTEKAPIVIDAPVVFDNREVGRMVYTAYNDESRRVGG